MNKKKIVLSIAGSDSGAGAGVQADMKSIMAVGGYCATAITAITAQNTQGVESIYPIPANIVEAQIEAIMNDMDVDVIKTGMLPSIDIIMVVCNAIKRYNIKKVVVDPVMVATSGDKLVDGSAAEYMVKNLFALASIITPNIPETEAICGFKILKESDYANAAEYLSSLKVASALIKGGHSNDDIVMDRFYNFISSKKSVISHNRIQTNNTHGTGCSLASSIAGYLSLGYDAERSVEMAVEYISKAIERGAEWKIGDGASPIKHL